MYSLFNNTMFDLMSQLDSRVSNVDIWESDNKYFLDIEVPGNGNEDINIKEENGLLSVKSKYFTRCFDVSNKIDLDKIEAKLNDGLLSITLEKKGEEQGRTISLS